jgi:hypothetical protein
VASVGIAISFCPYISDYSKDWQKRQLGTSLVAAMQNLRLAAYGTLLPFNSLASSSEIGNSNTAFGLS